MDARGRDRQIVFGIIRLFDQTPGCIYRGTFSGDITDTRLGLCANDFWKSGTEWFVVGAAIAGGVALFVMALVTETKRRSTRSLVRVGLGAMLVAVGAVFVVGAVAAHGTYPTGLSDPVAVVLGVTGAISIVLALLMLVSKPRVHREGTQPHLAIAALVAGAASLLAFLLLVLGNVSITQDHTLPTVARFVPVALGIVAVLLGVLGVATSHGDAPRIRASSAALVMGLGSAVMPIWLWASYCYLFKDCT